MSERYHLIRQGPGQALFAEDADRITSDVTVSSPLIVQFRRQAWTGKMIAQVLEEWDEGILVDGKPVWRTHRFRWRDMRPDEGAVAFRTVKVA